jgi:hypothetical protein
MPDKKSFVDQDIWIKYEKFKKDISDINLTPEQYEKIIKSISELLGL